MDHNFNTPLDHTTDIWMNECSTECKDIQDKNSGCGRSDEEESHVKRTWEALDSIPKE
jgi:hypothetical protein